GVGDRPLRLLRAVRGLELVELPLAEQCCGFGGTFALKNSETSTAMLADKMRNVLDTGAQVLCAGDNSCLMHIGGGLSRLKTGVQTVHLASILASTEEEPWAAATRWPGWAVQPFRRPRTRRWPTRNYVATCAKRPRRSGPSAPRSSPRWRTGSGCAARARRRSGERRVGKVRRPRRGGSTVAKKEAEEGA